MALGIAVALEAARQAALVTVSGIVAADKTATVERTGPSGTSAGVRGTVARDVSTGGAGFTVRDYEAPLGVPLTYKVTTFDAAGAVLSTATAAFTLAADAGDDPWLVDLAFPLNSERVVVESLRELAYDTPTGVHRVLDRRAPVLTSGLASTPSADLVFITATVQEHDRARAILGTGVPVLLRTPPAQGVGNLYLGVKGWTEERASRIAFAGDRRFRCQVVQVDRPDPSVYQPVPPMTYATVKTTYATYAALKAAVPTYDALLYSYAGYVSPYAPWPPRDV